MWLLRTTDWHKLLQLPIDSWWAFLITMVGLVILIWWIVRLVARVNEDTDPAEADREMLLVLSELHREGDLTNEEYRSIKSQLVERLNTGDNRPSIANKAAETASAKNAGDADPPLTKTLGEPGKANEEDD